MLRATAHHLSLAKSRALGNGLVAWQSFDGGSCVDLSGNQNNGTPTASPSFTDTPFGGAVVLNGTNQNINLGTAANLLSLSPVTYAAWIKSANPWGANAGGAVFGASTSQQSPTLRINTNDNKLHFLKAGAADMGNSTGTIPNNEYTHVAVTYNNPNIVFYINGVASGTGSSAQTFTYTNMTIGSSNGGSTNWFIGSIGDARIYKRALTAAEIFAIYAERLVPDQDIELPALIIPTELGAVYLDPTQLGSNIVLSNLNLTATQMAAATANTRAIAHHASGKYYCEFTVDVSGDMQVGICNAVTPLTEYLGEDNTHSIGADDGGGWLGAGGTTTAPGLIAGHVYGLAIDINSKKAWIKDITAGGYWNSDAAANPVTGVGGATFTTIT